MHKVSRGEHVVGAIDYLDIASKLLLHLVHAFVFIVGTTTRHKDHDLFKRTFKELHAFPGPGVTERYLLPVLSGTHLLQESILNSLFHYAGIDHVLLVG